MRRLLLALLAIALVGAACSSSTDTAEVATDTTSDESTVDDTVADDTTADDDSSTDDTTEAAGETASTDAASSGEVEAFTIEIWVDNWMAVYVDGELVGEDSVSITTERSFNSEIFSFEASYPFTLAVEAKDYKETDSGLEYIGESNQQMGDGGLIAQVKDSSGAVVAVSSSDWASLVVHQAPINTDCESADDPDATCDFIITDTPADWTAVDFDDAAWTTATQWTAAEVDPKIGYDEIDWDGSAELIWGTDLQVDNTVLLRTVVTG